MKNKNIKKSSRILLFFLSLFFFIPMMNAEKLNYKINTEFEVICLNSDGSDDCLCGEISFLTLDSGDFYTGFYSGLFTFNSGGNTPPISPSTFESSTATSFDILDLTTSNIIVLKFKIPILGVDESTITIHTPDPYCDLEIVIQVPPFPENCPILDSETNIVNLNCENGHIDFQLEITTDTPGFDVDQSSFNIDNIINVISENGNSFEVELQDNNTISLNECLLDDTTTIYISFCIWTIYEGVEIHCCVNKTLENPCN